MTRHLNDDDRAQTRELHGQSYLATEIHNKTGRSFTTLTALIKHHAGIRPARHPDPTGRRLSDSDRTESALGISSGATLVAESPVHPCERIRSAQRSN